MTDIACMAFASENHGIEFIDNQTEWDGKWDLKTMIYDVLNNPKGLSLKDARKSFNFAMTTWDVEMDIDFHPSWFRKYRNQKPDITVEFKSPEEDRHFRETPSVLAYAYFPNQGSASGVIVFNSNYNWAMIGGNLTVKQARKKGYEINGNPPEDQLVKIYNFTQVLVHELGHMLGLRHDVSGNRDGHDVMDAYYSGDRFDLSERDIYRIRLKYPAEQYKRWSRYSMIKRWLKLRVRRFKLL